MGYSPTTLGNGVPIYHKYILYTNNNGETYYARGGPGNSVIDFILNGDFGNIETEHGLYEEGTPDWDNDGIPDPRETIVEGDDLSELWNDIKSNMDNIESERHVYDPMGMNSSSTVDETLRRSGLPEPTLDGPNQNWSLGSGLDIPGGVMRL